MLKNTFGVSDRVTYSHPLDPPFDGHYATVEATIMEISDRAERNVRLSCKLGSISEPKIIQLWTTFDRLTQLTQIPDPYLSSRRFSKAQKIDSSDWNSWILDDKVDKYFENIEDLLEFYGEEEIEDLPTFAWATKATRVSIEGAEDLVNSLLAERDVDEESYEANDFKGLSDLDKAITNFNQLNADKILYYPDYSIAITFNPAEERRLLCGL